MTLPVRRALAFTLGAALLGLAAGAAPPGPGIDLGGIDKSVAPGDDFFAYANGAWLKSTEIPADKAGYGVGTQVFDLTNQRTIEIIKNAEGGSDPDAQKVADYYASYVDQEAIDKKGLRPLQPSLGRIDGIVDPTTLSRFLGWTLRADVDALNATNFYTDHVFGLWVAQDFNDPKRYVPFLLQGGLDMPDRAYYLDESERMATLRKNLQGHIANVLSFTGTGNVEARAAKVLELEKKIAQAHTSREESEDVKKANNRWTRKDFDAKAPGMDWKEYFTSAELAAQPEFIVWQPGAVTGISALVASEPVDAWKDYLRFHAIDHYAAVLPAVVQEERFAFHGTALSGTPKQRERALRGVDSTNFALGDAVGRLYVAKYFPPAAKARANAMVQNLLKAFGRRIDTLAWMTKGTKKKAKAKLAVLKVGVGYPDRWKDYGPLEIKRGDAFGNLQRAESYEYQRSLKKLGQPVDRGEWVMTPQTVNAVNLPVMNAMNFPAAILQPPFFDALRPIAMDYGAIGAVIGHEISHSFDDLGAQFDAQGRLQNWWTDKDKAHFEAAAAKLVKQYDGYKPFPDLNVSGKLTLSENIADVAGLAVAYDAYRLALGGQPAPVVEGLSGDQQFFLSFAQSWRGKLREPALRQQVLADGHAPNEYRGSTVRNLDPWYTAFDVKPGQALHLPPPDRVRVW
jgi:putative endopeptidase